MNPQQCAIDNGFGDTKYKTEGAMSKFRSRVEKTSDEISSNTIEVDNIKYKFGAGQDDIDLQKVYKDVHKICTLASLALTMKEDTAEFRVVLALPIMQHKNEDLREEFKNYAAKPGSSTNVKLNGQAKKIIIRDSAVAAQGGAALYADMNKLQEYKKTLTAVVDWGNVTINGFICEGLDPIPGSKFTENLGTTILTSKITTAINSRYGLNVQDYQIPYLIHNTPKYLEQVIMDTEDEHFEDVIRIMRKKNWSVETLDMLGVGGGFLMVRPIVKRYFQKLEIAPNPVYANVLGMYNIGRMIWK